ncbi:MAG: TetR/AcrR family transcriptional regulator [Acidobacteria bacterium]|nr:TetR/AcrR family transcriptional regulator [Acidobacteriota bacterium]
MGLSTEQERKVLDAAMNLAAARDIDAITLDELAKEAGVPGYAIGLHYRSRENILIAALDRELAVIAGAVAPPELRFPGETLLDEVQMIAKIMLGEYRSRLPFLSRLLTQAMKSPDVGAIFYRSFIMKGRFLFTDFLNERKRRGELREDVDIEVAAAVFLAALTSVFLVVEIVGGKQVEHLDEERLVRSMADVFLNGVGRGT